MVWLKIKNKNTTVLICKLQSNSARVGNINLLRSETFISTTKSWNKKRDRRKSRVEGTDDLTIFALGLGIAHKTVQTDSKLMLNKAKLSP